MNLIAPPDLSLADDPVIYKVLDAEPLAQLTLQFLIGNTNYINIVAYADSQGVAIVDISDLLIPFTPTLSFDYIGHSLTGGVRFALRAINNAPIPVPESHYAIRGTVGTYNKRNKQTIESLIIDTNATPFLTGRVKSNYVSYYRSELLYADLYYVKADENTLTWITDRGNEFQDKGNTCGGTVEVLSGKALATRYNPGGGLEPYYYNSLTGTLTEPGEIPLATFFIYIDDDPIADEKHIMRFINNYGVWECILICSPLYNNPDIDDAPEYLQEDASFVRPKHLQRRTLTEKYTINSGLLDNIRLRLIKEMLQSDSVQILIDEKWYDCKVNAAIDIEVTIRTPQSVQLNIEIL